MRPTRLLYAATIFLSSLLLFLIEPIAAKQLLPILGGSSAVWLTCLVFFQITLLLGYLYAHQLTRRQSADKAGKWPEDAHLSTIATAAILVLTSLNTHVAINPDHPVRAIFITLVSTIGLPFLLLTSTSPLLQVWLARSESTAVPYRLFALSNVGSLLALFLYPTLIEPNLSLSHQRQLWLAGFLLYAILSVQLTLRVRASRWNPTNSEVAIALDTLTAPASAPPTTRQLHLWFLLPMAAAMQLTAVTAHLTQNIAAIPLLWMLPLSVYLLSFILAFEYSRLYSRPIITRLLVVFICALGYELSKTDTAFPIALTIIVFLVECFVACLFCHAETHSLRPTDPRQTTLFYLLIAAGGATGTFFIGIACPLLFSANYDLALAFLVTAALALAVLWQDYAQRALWTTATIGMLVLAIMLHIAYTRDALFLTRNFYGSLRVKQTYHAPHQDLAANEPQNLPVNQQAAPTRMFLNGTIQHGTQIFSSALSHTPTTYYATNSGIGLALTLCCNGRPRNIGVIGLGAGTLAAYGQPGDRFRFYELNPAVPPVAQTLFTYLRDSPAQNTIIPGDGRASLTKESPQQFDVLVIDAFSGDAIPLHLLTTQAIALYQRHLAPGGILAFHVSNQYVDLAPEITLLAANAHLTPILIDSPANTAEGAYRASWVLVTNNPTFLNDPAVTANTVPIDKVPGTRLWTDDYSSLVPLLKF